MGGGGGGGGGGVMSNTANNLLIQNFVNSLKFVVPANNSGLKACTFLHTTVISPWYNDVRVYLDDWCASINIGVHMGTVYHHGDGGCNDVCTWMTGVLVLILECIWGRSITTETVGAMMCVPG